MTGTPVSRRRFDAAFQATGIRAIRSAVQAPRMNSIMERWIGSCRHELLDRTLIWNRRHLMMVSALTLQDRRQPDTRRLPRPCRQTGATGKHRRLGRTRRPLISSAEPDAGHSRRPRAQPHRPPRPTASRMTTSAAAPTPPDERAGDRYRESWASRPRTFDQPACWAATSPARVPPRVSMAEVVMGW
jgi:hypothetical protein